MWENVAEASLPKYPGTSVNQPLQTDIPCSIYGLKTYWQTTFRGLESAPTVPRLS